MSAGTSDSPAPLPASPLPWWRRGSLSLRIVIGLLLGVLVGLFFGESAAVLQPLGDVYVRLMQMTVLPYLVLTLLIGLGQLDAAAARRLAWRALPILALYWVLAMAVVAAMALALPSMPSATFYNPAFVDEPRTLSFADLYVPSNPFSSLANAVVPAVVLFTGAVGIALIGVPQRQLLLDTLHVAEAAVMRVTRFIIGLTPIGAFAICAVAAGTLEPRTLMRLEAYLVSFAIASVLLGFVIIPVTVTAFTPFRYRDVIGSVKDALLTAFFANSVFIVLPILTDRAKALVASQGRSTAETDSAAEVLVPISFTFPNAGRLLTLLFVPFTAWTSGVGFGPGDYATLFGVGLGSYFAKAQVALPFLMELIGIPRGLIDLYIPTTVITGKFDSMVSAVNLFAIALLGAASLGGFLRFDTRRVLRALVVVLAALGVGNLAARGAIALLVDTSYHQDEVLMRMHLPPTLLPTVVHESMPEGACLAADARPRIQQLRERGYLRVGFVPDSAPYAFRNARGALVGFDLEIAGRLARDLGVARLELVPVGWDTMGGALQDCRIDLVVSVPPTLVRPEQMRFSQPYLDTVVALAVAGGRRNEFATIQAMRRLASVTIGVPPLGDVAHRDETTIFPGVRANFVEIVSPRDFFEGRAAGVDALLLRAESAASWTLLYPRFAFVVPQPHPLRTPLAMGMRPGDLQLAAFVDNWLTVQAADGTVEQARRYWMLGRGREAAAATRWSIRHDVLGW